VLAVTYNTVIEAIHNIELNQFTGQSKASWLIIILFCCGLQLAVEVLLDYSNDGATRQLHHSTTP
ncbi:hypothetical protein J6590_107620, partial [Homalodisca vitripennis]